MGDFDFGTVRLPPRAVAPVDPLAIFASIRPRISELKNLWLEQGDALRTWHEKHRGDSDVAILLNTGAGKTLVGLLCAQSLINETRGKVVYLCSTRQLVEQTAEKADEYGLPATVYLDQSYSNDLYSKNQACCITTYAAVFNGLTRRFRNDEPSGYILDDAHTAEHIIRSAYTMTLTRERHAPTVAQIFALFRTYFAGIDRVVRYDEFAAGQGDNEFALIPPFVVKANREELRRILVAANLGSDETEKFVWGHLNESSDLCAIFVAPGKVSFTPPFLPIRQHYTMSDTTRRIYLSATLDVEDAFVRTFGRRPTIIRASQSSAGECERMILVPSEFDSDDSDENLTKALVEPYKTLISVPTYARAEDWEDVANIADDVAATITAFKAATDNRKIILVSRYDGVDLPDDACRVMVIDDLPSGAGFLERFMFEKLGLLKALRSSIASRIVQCFGRISRGTRDHGVFFLTGSRLIDWLRNPKNERALSPFLRKQINIGSVLSDQLDPKQAANLIEQCLNRDKSDQWTAWYGAQLEAQGEMPLEPESADLVQLATIEVDFWDLVWSRRYQEGAQYLAERIDDAFVASQKSGAWYSMWLGYAYDLQGDARAANRFYSRAAGAAVNVLPAPLGEQPPELQQLPQQIRMLNDEMNYADNKGKMDAALTKMRTQLAALSGGEPNDVTLALLALGKYLGANSSRPDDEGSTGGPDNCWWLGDVAFCFEAKTDKKPGSCYNKKELGQVDDHARWARGHTEARDIESIFVGPILAACEKTNPGDQFVVIELNEFRELGDRLTAAISDVAAKLAPILFAHDIYEMFKERRLLYPDCVRHLRRSVITLDD
jgi:Type III restriction enzyme, res subunit